MHASRLSAGASAFLAAARRGLAPERQPAAIQELGVGIGSGVALTAEDPQFQQALLGVAALTYDFSHGPGGPAGSAQILW
jgi:hypothetical protein